MALGTITAGLAFALLALNTPVPATVVPPDLVPAPLADHQFDLADVPGAAAALRNPRSHRFGQPPIDPAQLQGTRWTPPAKSWGSAGAGPVLEIGALGSRRRRGPDLAHISLDWDF